MCGVGKRLSSDTPLFDTSLYTSSPCSPHLHAVYRMQVRGLGVVHVGLGCIQTAFLIRLTTHPIVYTGSQCEGRVRMCGALFDAYPYTRFSILGYNIRSVSLPFRLVLPPVRYIRRSGCQGQGSGVCGWNKRSAAFFLNLPTHPLSV